MIAPSTASMRRTAATPAQSPMASPRAPARTLAQAVSSAGKVEARNAKSRAESLGAGANRKSSHAGLQPQ